MNRAEREEGLGASTPFPGAPLSLGLQVFTNQEAVWILSCGVFIEASLQGMVDKIIEHWGLIQPPPTLPSPEVVVGQKGPTF